MKKKVRKQQGTKALFAYEMTVPTIAVILIMTVYPVIFTVLYSFTDYNYLKGTYSWLGLKNYKDLISNAFFRQSVWNTIVFTLIAVVIEILLGLLLALYVNSLKMKKGKKVFRTLVLLPYLLPAVTVALIWRMMLSPNYGIVTHIFEALGVSAYNWFYDMKTAFGTILVIDIWQNTPFAFLLLYACLQGVSESQKEAAAIDGAGYAQTFIHVVLPNISSGIALCAMLRTIDTFRLFEKVNILTGGGPAGTTSTITQFMYTYGIKTLKFGFASASSIIMTILVLIFSVGYVKKAIHTD
ncbi:carbohydrate ABC transporter permease [Blautia sp.]|jgi:multiple sugar transport system permease protein|uniref:carbohydrate ABC transporter permease n=1 Tax=Blautia sp. TaxID=1955243 RepID=UPI002A74A512|nr:sugar ABC transporter permease [Blautia sp.]MDY3017515.1 sugar ABC transporter permease [Blautia sp.]